MSGLDEQPYVAVYLNKEKINSDVRELHRFLISMNFNVREENLSRDFVIGMTLLMGIKGSTAYFDVLCDAYLKWVGEII